MMWITNAIIAGVIGVSAMGGVVGALHIRHPHGAGTAQKTPVKAHRALPSGAPSSALAVMAQAAAATSALQSLQSDLTWTLGTKGKSATVTGGACRAAPQL